MALYKAWDYVNENNSGTKVGTLTLNGQSFEVKDNQADTSVTFSSIRNTTNTSAGSGTVRKIGKMVYMSFSATLANALAASTWLTIGTVPEAYRPPSSIVSVVVTTTSIPIFLILNLSSTDGGIGVKSDTAISSGSKVTGSMTWFVE